MIWFVIEGRIEKLLGGGSDCNQNLKKLYLIKYAELEKKINNIVRKESKISRCPIFC